MRQMTRPGPFLVLLLLLALTACGAARNSATEETAPQEPPAEDEPEKRENPTAEPPAEPTRDRSMREELEGGQKTPERVPTIESGEAVVGEVPDDMMTAVLDDLNEQTGADPDDVTVLRAEQALWSDGSLGCPKPGEMYTQAIVEGYWIELEYMGVTYDYRASETGYFFLCENPSPGPGGAPVG